MTIRSSLTVKRCLVAGVAIALSLEVLLVAQPARAAGPSQTSAPAQPSSAAVVTPLLRFFDFGDVVGLPLVCGVATSTVSAGLAQANLDQYAGPIVTLVSGRCADASQQGDAYLQQAITQSQSLSVINPAVNPVLGATATGLQTLGTQYGQGLAPLGPTVAGLGSTVTYFEGS